MLETVLFYFLATVLLVFAVLVVSRTNPLPGALSLVGAFAALAGLYGLLSAGFLAMVQILVYAGGVVVLIVFVIMLLNLKSENLEPLAVRPGVLALVLVGTLLGLALPLATVFTRGRLASFAPLEAARFGSIATSAGALFTTHVFAFELLSLVLLAAIVGALVLAKGRL